MARLACPCLNINVFVTGSDWRSDPVPTSKLFRDLCPVKGDVAYEVNLDVGGIVVELAVLAFNQRAGDWIINSCFNCGTDIYITHVVKGDKTFVLPGVVADGLIHREQSGEEAISNLCQDKNYSSIFKILLKSTPDGGDIVRRKRVSSMSFGREDPHMKVVHQQMKSYLKSEEAAMEERIRAFEDQQREAFLTLQDNAHRERSLLFAAIAKAQEKGHSGVVKDVRILDSEKEEVCTADKNNKTKDEVDKPATERVTVTIQDKASYLLPKMPQQDESQEDSLFALDGFDEEQAYGDHAHVPDIGGDAFPQSDDDDSSTNDSSFRDMSALSGINLATSVPVGIPLFRPSTDTPTSSNNQSGLEANDVGNSIRQLALSVQDTGMFGDLPRPRMMTNPFS